LNTIFTDKPSRLFAIKHTCTAIQPLSIRISFLLNLINPSNTSIARNRVTPIPPWLLRKPIVNLHLSQHSSKASTPPNTYTNYYEHKQYYLQYNEIFTDGSKAMDKVSAACIFIKSKFSRRINLPPYTSIFTTELAAIKLALTSICKTKYKQHIIFSDSMSALQTISHQHTNSPLILDILLLLNDLYNHNFYIIFFWIPSHVGIIGNTKVDLLAKTPSLFPISNISITATDFLSMSTQSFKINGNRVGIYTPIINCTKFIQTSLHFLRRYLTHLLEKNKLL